MKKLFILILLFLPVFVSSQEKVNINTATLEQLETLIGIGPVYGQRIIDARPFSSVDDLIKVSGIGEKTLQKIKDQGLAFVNDQLIENEIEETPEATIQEEIETLEIEPLKISYPGGIFISKIMPSPEGADATEEYIEIRNDNSFEVDLAGWKIRDKVGSTREYVLDKKIQDVLTLKRTETNITLNNSGDGLELLNPNNEIVDSVDFGKAQTGIAFIKTFSGWQWDIKKQPVQKTQIISQSDDQISQTVEIDLVKEKESNVSVFLTGILIALISALVFIVLKRKLYRDQVSFP